MNFNNPRSDINADQDMKQRFFPLEKTKENKTPQTRVNGFFFLIASPGDIVTQVGNEPLAVQVGLEVGVLVHLPTRQSGHLK